MPESFPSSPETRYSGLQDFIRTKEAAEISKNRCQGQRRMAPSISGTSGHGIDHRHHHPGDNGSGDGRSRPQRRGAARSTNPRRQGTVNETVVPGSGRKPGTSQYYGVRFRPDLKKWVAEIRVAEWKAVDKKVWLGTFETEQAAARGVDLARKLLKCKKKHPPNLPCDELAAYSTQIPSHLILTDLAAATMFKAATLFIKHECKEYAASFDDTPQAVAPTGPICEYSIGADSDFSDMILEMTTIAEGLHHVPCGLEVDSHESAATRNYCNQYAVGMSSSPTGSCNSTVTLEALQVPETWDCHDPCGTASSSSSSEIIEGSLSMMVTDHVSAASHQHAHDACFWPELQDPFYLSDSLYGSTLYSLPMYGNYVAPMDSDAWLSFPGGLHQGWQ